MGHTLTSVLLGCALLTPFALGGCGAVPGPGEPGAGAEIEAVQGEIIGGWTITDATRRSQGLVSVDSSGCSASLIAPDWVVTSTHCLNFGLASSNKFSVPTTFGWVETRSAEKLYPGAASDVTLVKLTGTASVNWPNVTHPLYANAPSTLVGKDIICYGQGQTGYASPSGLTGGGVWKTVTKRVDHVDADNTLVVLANSSGSDIMAFGDSGGPCYYNNALVSVNWQLYSFTCTDQSTPAKCAATLTHIGGVMVRTVAEFSSYITAAMTGRPAANWVPLTLQSDWKNWPTSAYNAASMAMGQTVYLRGNISNGSGAPLFTLPLAQRPSAVVYLSVPLVNAKKGRLRIGTDGVVTVAAESGDFRDAIGAVWLDGVSFSLSAAGFTAIPLQNGWTTTGYGTRGIAAQDEGGVVRMQGAIATASTNTNMQPFVLPSSLRPSSNVYVTVDLYGGKKGRAFITSSGTVTISAEVAGTSAQGFTSFEGVSFTRNYGGESWTPANGWASSPYGTNALTVKNSGGVVMLSGAVTTSGTSQYITQLPAQYRPAGTVSAAGDLCGGAYGRIIIQPDGWLLVQDRQQFSSSAKCFTSLEGVQFGL